MSGRPRPAGGRMPRDGDPGAMVMLEFRTESSDTLFNLSIFSGKETG
jgi:hypothetical protein